MKRFRTAFFNGYQREEVDEYIDSLVQELERFKAEMTRRLEAEQKKIEELQEKIDAGKEEKTDLLEKIESMERQEQSSKKEDFEHTAELKALKQKVQDYEKNYSNLANVLANAKVEADHILTSAKTDAKALKDEAKQNAESLTSIAQRDSEKMKREAEMAAELISRTAKEKADAYRQQVEADLKKKREEDSQKFKAAKYNLIEYLNALNNSQSKLIETYNELGVLVKKMPIRIDDIFSEAPMELLPEQERVDKPQNHTTVVEDEVKGK